MATTIPWGRMAGDDAQDQEDEAAGPVEQFRFTGTAREYFGIWIVNILLTILTLGIYSAWAKVRRLRYFYGSTALAGSTFDYHARPVQILIGRIIVLALIVAYNGALTLFPITSLFLGAGFFFAVPFFVMRGLRFNARVTSYRNVRFDFTGGYWGAFRAYVVGWFLAWISLGILVPVASRWMWTYTLGNVTYGRRPVTTDPRLGALYGQWIVPAVIVSVGTGFFSLSIIALAAGFFGATGQMPDIDDPEALILAFLGVIWVSLIPMLILLGVAALFYRAGTRNVAFNATLIDGRHRLVSTVGRRRYAWIAVTNVLATFATLGLARPWAAVRMARYMAATTALQCSGSLDDFISAAQAEGGAVGAEYMDVEGLDFGF